MQKGCTMQQWQRTLLSFCWTGECSKPVRIRCQVCCEIRSGFHFVLGTTASEGGLGFCSLLLLITLCPTTEQHPENTQSSMQVMPFKTWQCLDKWYLDISHTKHTYYSYTCELHTAILIPNSLLIPLGIWRPTSAVGAASSHGLLYSSRAAF